MDLNTPPKYLFIFRNPQMKDHYIIIYSYEIMANSFFEKTSMTGPKYGVPPADGIPYAHFQCPLERVLQADDVDEKFADFLRNIIAKKEDAPFPHGWYILKEIDMNKWKSLFQIKLAEQRRVLLETANKEKKAEQIKLF